MRDDSPRLPLPQIRGAKITGLWMDEAEQLQRISAEFGRIRVGKTDALRVRRVGNDL